MQLISSTREFEEKLKTIKIPICGSCYSTIPLDDINLIVKDIPFCSSCSQIYVRVPKLEVKACNKKA